MARQVDSFQDGGWPLGLQPLHVRAGLRRHCDSYSSMSFSSLLSGSPTSSIASSTDFDAKSAGSFLRDRGNTLGSLLGISSILGPSRRSIRRRRQDEARGPRCAWLSLCAGAACGGKDPAPPSLGQFLDVERRRRATYELEGLQAAAEWDGDGNSLFQDGGVAPPRPSPRPAEASRGGLLLCPWPCLRA